MKQQGDPRSEYGGCWASTQTFRQGYEVAVGLSRSIRSLSERLPSQNDVCCFFFRREELQNLRVPKNMNPVVVVVLAWILAPVVIVGFRRTWMLVIDLFERAFPRKPVQVQKSLLRLKTDDSYASALRLNFDRRIIGR